ncbi:leucine-rich repeat domain-containing protein [Goodfellowiella coeruleoviolacea]|uniref:hypothetical protein n=1 Tax=Goodfellowiella coeruleoviolacea TaxID=334858 RepID=UPI0020A325B2|nr:hypothetical protein [Goodfellowiella coeruleoviolacea]
MLHDFGDRDLAATVAGRDDHPWIRRLYLNDAVHLDLTALAPLRNLRELSVNRAKSVLPRLADQPALESVSIDADQVDLDLLAGRPSLWALRLSGVTGPVSTGPLRTLPALTRLELAGLDVVDIEQVAELPALRVLALDWDQWQRLRAANAVPPGLAAARLDGNTSLATAVDWATWLSQACSARPPQLSALTGTVYADRG